MHKFCAKKNVGAMASTKKEEEWGARKKWSMEEKWKIGGKRQRRVVGDWGIEALGSLALS